MNFPLPFALGARHQLSVKVKQAMAMTERTEHSGSSWCVACGFAHGVPRGPVRETASERRYFFNCAASHAATSAGAEASSRSSADLPYVATSVF